MAPGCATVGRQLPLTGRVANKDVGAIFAPFVLVFARVCSGGAGPRRASYKQQHAGRSEDGGQGQVHVEFVKDRITMDVLSLTELMLSFQAADILGVDKGGEPREFGAAKGTSRRVFILRSSR